MSGPDYAQVRTAEMGDRRLVLVSGQVAMRDGEVVGEGDMRRQTEVVYERIAELLESVGATMADVLKTTTFITDMSRLQEVRDGRARFLADPPPASSLVEVSALVDPRLLTEVEVIAVVPGERPGAGVV